MVKVCKSNNLLFMLPHVTCNCNSSICDIFDTYKMFRKFTYKIRVENLYTMTIPFEIYLYLFI